MGIKEEKWGPEHTSCSGLSPLIPQVQPTMSKFEMDTYAKSHDLMSGFWNACYDMLMSSGQCQRREHIQSQRAFQVCSPERGTVCYLTYMPGRQLIGQPGRDWVGEAAASGTDLFFPPQELVLEPAQRRARLEGLRYAAVLKQQAAQHSTALLHWGALWRQLSSPCGAWALRWAGLQGGGAGLGANGTFRGSRLPLALCSRS